MGLSYGIPMATARHPLSRALEGFGVLAIIAMALVSALLVLEAEHRTRQVEQERRLLTVARAAADLLDLTPFDASSTITALPERLGRGPARDRARRQRRGRDQRGRSWRPRALVGRRRDLSRCRRGTAGLAPARG